MGNEELDILKHTIRTGQPYCGGSPEMDRLVERRFMKYCGKKSFVPDPYFRITDKGRVAAHVATPGGI
jgi:hypothetical protein